MFGLKKIPSTHSMCVVYCVICMQWIQYIDVFLDHKRHKNMNSKSKNRNKKPLGSVCIIVYTIIWIKCGHYIIHKICITSLNWKWCGRNGNDFFLNQEHNLCQLSTKLSRYNSSGKRCWSFKFCSEHKIIWSSKLKSNFSKKPAKKNLYCHGGKINLNF